MIRRLYIIAGEKSGDQYGAQLVRAFGMLQPGIDFYGFGGQEMEAEGVHLTRKLEHLEIIGFTEVLARYRTIRKNFRKAKRDLKNIDPDALILIDYPGFNLRMAKWASNRGIPVYYFIPPQTWAWKRSRNKVLAQHVRKVFHILPFESRIFEEDGVEAIYVGHPMVEIIDQFLVDQQKDQTKSLKTTIAVLPGSRRQEIERFTPVLVSIFEKLSDHHFIVAAISSLPEQFYKPFLNCKNVEIVYDSPMVVMHQADIGLIKSGTSTLQAALLGLPQVVFYRVSKLSGWIMKRLAKVDYVALPNLIMGREIVKELLQEQFTAEQVLQHIQNLEDPAFLSKLNLAYSEIRKKLQKDGTTAKMVAREINDDIDQFGI
jgi:lipid-A-disaccharide synthase